MYLIQYETKGGFKRAFRLEYISETCAREIVNSIVLDNQIVRVELLNEKETLLIIEQR